MKWVCENVLFVSDCDEFTVDSCSPDPSQVFNTVVLPKDGVQMGLCEDLCNTQWKCAYWSIFCETQNPIETCSCTFYEYSYLHSCQRVGGDKDTDIEVIFLRGAILVRSFKSGGILSI